MKLFGRGIVGLSLALACSLIVGCQSGTQSDNPAAFASNPLGDNASPVAADKGLPGSGPQTNIILHAGDTISVKFNDVPTPPAAIDDQIKEDGSITLYYNEKFQAAGKSIHELQTEIHERYVTNYYRFMTPSVQVADRYFTIGGEVRIPNRYPFAPGLTVLRAIDQAGGFNEFAKKSKVTVTRSVTGRQEVENCTKALKNPELDLLVYPGDKIFVHKRLW